MDWLWKLNEAKAASKLIPEMAIVFAAYEGMDIAEIDTLRRSFPFIDEDYPRFLAETDGLQIDMYQLFGSGKSDLTPLTVGFRRWEPILNDQGVPIGEDPSGDAIVLCEDGSVRLVSLEMDTLKEGRILAESFGDFLSNVLMGERFTTLLPGEWSKEYENEWTRFLRERRWLRT